MVPQTTIECTNCHVRYKGACSQPTTSNMQFLPHFDQNWNVSANFRELWCSHDRDYKKCCLLGCDAVESGGSPIPLQRNLQPRSFRDTWGKKTSYLGTEGGRILPKRQ